MGRRIAEKLSKFINFSAFTRLCCSTTHHVGMTFAPGWILLGLLAALGGAGVTLFGRLGLEGGHATLATTLRAVIVDAVMFAVSLSSGQLQPCYFIPSRHRELADAQAINAHNECINAIK